MTIHGVKFISTFLCKIFEIFNNISDKESNLYINFDEKYKLKFGTDIRPINIERFTLSPEVRYEFKLKAPVSAKSGKKSYDLFSKGRFAWVVDREDEAKLNVTMKELLLKMIRKISLYLLLWKHSEDL